MGKALREGFTTGTSAAAAAKAAVLLLCGKACPAVVDTPLPLAVERGPEKAGGPARLNIPVSVFSEAEDIPPKTATASVIKDGGDDPDATHGMRIIACASLRPFEGWGAPLELPATGRSQVLLYAGQGIGRVTLPGLPVAVGEPAVNPAPRRQIAAAVDEAFVECGLEGPVYVLLFAPEGEERARRTLNARLGIVGGISILGTQGTVRPYSHDAWKTAIIQGFDVAVALGIDTVLLSTGRRSERALFALYPHLPPQAGIQVADYAAFAMEGAGERPFARVVWGCFAGKLLKLAQGLEWTHAKSAAADISLMAALCREEARAANRAGALADLPENVAAMPTASGALALIEAHDSSLHTAVLRRLGEAAYVNLALWLRRGAQKKNVPAPQLLLYIFSLEGRLALILNGAALPEK